MRSILDSRSRHVFLLALVCLFSTFGHAGELATVTRVVDGDTLEVSIAGRIEKVRLIGVDTPETVHPQKPVEYFGKEASAFTRRMVEGKTVRLEPDTQNTNRDKYNRLLRYVYLPDGRLLNAEIISQGYGHAYTRFPFSKMEEFRALEREAREANRGLWGDGGESAGRATTASGEHTVYVTRTGSKYHQEGCRHLSKSKIPSSLADAAASYDPCKACKPPIPE